MHFLISKEKVNFALDYFGLETLILLHFEISCGWDFDYRRFFFIKFWVNFEKESFGGFLMKKDRLATFLCSCVSWLKFDEPVKGSRSELDTPYS